MDSSSMMVLSLARSLLGLGRGRARRYFGEGGWAAEVAMAVLLSAVVSPVAAAAGQASEGGGGA